MNETLSRLSDILKKDGYSLTKPRRAVFQFLLGKEPVTMSDITKVLMPTVDRASVYRTVALFQELGIIQRHNVGWKYTIELSDTFSEHHHHITCIRCGKVTSINEKALERSVEDLARQYGYRATGHQIELQGYCAACA
ncbi:MAG: transcriptional repressor [Candidatus Nomurabacteria bacterium]|nr:MAG: transcriptional repressor [Candidatus Nomurabacteria bacterium]